MGVVIRQTLVGGIYGLIFADKPTPVIFHLRSLS